MFGGEGQRLNNASHLKKNGFVEQEAERKERTSGGEGRNWKLRKFPLKGERRWGKKTFFLLFFPAASVKIWSGKGDG